MQGCNYFTLEQQIANPGLAFITEFIEAITGTVKEAEIEEETITDSEVAE